MRTLCISPHTHAHPVHPVQTLGQKPCRSKPWSKYGPNPQAMKGSSPRLERSRPPHAELPIQTAELAAGEGLDGVIVAPAELQRPVECNHLDRMVRCVRRGALEFARGAAVAREAAVSTAAKLNAATASAPGRAESGGLGTRLAREHRVVGRGSG